MWWTTAEKDVTWLGENEGYAPRMRVATGWVSANKFDVPFDISSLSSRLTKVASTQLTLCRVDAADYVLRKIVNLPEPSAKAAHEARQAMLRAIVGLLKDLHWSDFETLVDLLLARSGWNRVTALGGNVKDHDMVVEQAVTLSRAFVQVKSAADQTVLDTYVRLFDEASEWDLMVFACHSPTGALQSSRANVLIWADESLAEMILRNGLCDWLVAHVA